MHYQAHTQGSEPDPIHHVTFIPTNILVPAFVQTQVREGRDKTFASHPQQKPLLLLTYVMRKQQFINDLWAEEQMLPYVHKTRHLRHFPARYQHYWGREYHTVISSYHEPSYTPLAISQVPLPGSGLRGWLTLPCVHLELLTTKGHPGQPTWLCRNHSFSLPGSIPRKWMKIKTKSGSDFLVIQCCWQSKAQPSTLTVCSTKAITATRSVLSILYSRKFLTVPLLPTGNCIKLSQVREKKGVLNSQ